MKLVEKKCPSCGAPLDFEAYAKNVTCQYCGTPFLLEGDDAESEPAACAQQMPSVAPALSYEQASSGEASVPPKKRKTWLWVLGWIFIFPVPLTILLLRNQKIDQRLRYVLVVLVWIVYLGICAGTNASESNESATASSASAAIVAEASHS